LLKTVRTPKYVPVHLWFAGDHSLWSFGSPCDAEGRPDPQGMTVRKYLRRDWNQPAPHAGGRASPSRPTGSDSGRCRASTAAKRNGSNWAWMESCSAAGGSIGSLAKGIRR
jgi:hypothetical protein